MRAATRGSALALAQTAIVDRLLGGGVESVVVETSGDRRTDVPIHAIGGQGVFVKEVQQAVLDGRADIAVHSAKDLPSEPTPGLVLAAVPQRDDPRDVLVGATLHTLAVGARVATGSVRRRAQLASLRPDVTFAELRGNVGTRLDKAPAFGAIVMAAAALRRLGLADRITEALDPALVLPQVAQGALAVECRADDLDTANAVAAIEHGPSRRAVDAERAFLAALGGGCDLPTGAYATVLDDSGIDDSGIDDSGIDDSGIDDGDIELTGLLASLDGHVVIRAECRGRDPSAIGSELAHRLLHDAGGSALPGFSP